MNRIHLFLLFVIFLLIPLSAPALSGLLPVPLLGCDSVAVHEAMIVRECNPQVVQANDLPVLEFSSGLTDATTAGNSASAKSPSIPLNLRELMQDEQSNNRKQWLLLTVFAVVILLAARIAPSMK